MLRHDLEVQPRESAPEIKKNPNALRRDGWVPAVLYGHGEPVPVIVPIKTLNKALHSEGGASAIFNVKLGDKSDMTVIKEIQRDIFTRQPIHVDFQRIDAKDKIEVTIPVHIKGESNGVKNQGGILEHIQREIQIKCFPADLISVIDVDVTNLNIHQAIKVSDLKVSAGVEILTPGDHIVVNIVSPRVEEEKPVAGATLEAGAAQPEVIAKGKKEEEGATPAAPGAQAAAPAAKTEKKK